MRVSKDGGMFICCGFFFPPIKIPCVINLYFFDHMAIEFYSYTINVEISLESMNFVCSLSLSKKPLAIQ
jgi:hypothetical protein